MALGVIRVTARTHGNPSAVTEDIAQYVQDGDMVWVMAQARNVSTTTLTITGTGWTIRLPFRSHSDASNTMWWEAWSRRWTTGDPTSWTVTAVSSPQDVTVTVFIVRSDYDADSSHWTVVANTPQTVGTPGQLMNQLTPTTTSNDYRMFWFEGPTSSIIGMFDAHTPDGGEGPFWGGVFTGTGNDSGSGNDRVQLNTGRGILPVDTANALVNTHTNSQTIMMGAFSLYDGDANAYANGFTISGPNHKETYEIDAEVDAEGMDAGSPAGLTSAGGRFEGGSHIY